MKLTRTKYKSLGSANESISTNTVVVDSKPQQHITEQQALLFAQFVKEHHATILGNRFPGGVPQEIDVLGIQRSKSIPSNAFTTVQVLVTYELRGQLNKTYNVLQGIADMGRLEDGEAVLHEVNSLFTFSKVIRSVVQPDIEENDRYSDVGAMRHGKQETVTVHSLRYRLFSAVTMSIAGNGEPVVHAMFIPTPNLKDTWLTATPEQIQSIDPDECFNTDVDTEFGQYLMDRFDNRQAVGF